MGARAYCLVARRAGAHLSATLSREVPLCQLTCFALLLRRWREGASVPRYIFTRLARAGSPVAGHSPLAADRHLSDNSPMGLCVCRLGGSWSCFLSLGS